jgi:hypothetical protein
VQREPGGQAHAGWLKSSLCVAKKATLQGESALAGLAQPVAARRGRSSVYGPYHVHPDI